MSRIELSEVDVDPIFGWRIVRSQSWYWSNALNYIGQTSEINPDLKDVYQFGVATGQGLRHIAKKIKTVDGLPTVESFHGFDVFSGMPEEEKEPVFELNWVGGQCNELERRNVDSVEKVVQALHEEWEAENEQPLYIYDGLYKDSLPRLMAEGKLGNMRAALVVHLDCDLYTSTVEALEFMYSNQLIQPGTMLIYDDWGGTKSWQQAHSGESRAHKEMTIKHGVSYHHCWQFGVSHPGNNCPENIQRVYIVKEVGGSPTLDAEIEGTIVGSCANTLVDVNSEEPFTPQPWPEGY